MPKNEFYIEFGPDLLDDEALEDGETIFKLAVVEDTWKKIIRGLSIRERELLSELINAAFGMRALTRIRVTYDEPDRPDELEIRIVKKMGATWHEKTKEN